MPIALDEAQRDAVEAVDRAVMVVAGPGTGKTRVLTERASWLGFRVFAGVDPSRILAITYTNRAAGEMRARLGSREEESGKSQASGVTVLTFHAWAYRLVRQHFELLGFAQEPMVYDEESTDQLLRRLLGRNGFRRKRSRFDT